jgi:hypothetical protein
MNNELERTKAVKKVSAIFFPPAAGAANSWQH